MSPLPALLLTMVSPFGAVLNQCVYQLGRLAGGAEAADHHGRRRLWWILRHRSCRDKAVLSIMVVLQFPCVWPSESVGCASV